MNASPKKKIQYGQWIEKNLIIALYPCLHFPAEMILKLIEVRRVIVTKCNANKVYNSQPVYVYERYFNNSINYIASHNGWLCVSILLCVRCVCVSRCIHRFFFLHRSFLPLALISLSRDKRFWMNIVWCVVMDALQFILTWLQQIGRHHRSGGCSRVLWKVCVHLPYKKPDILIFFHRFCSDSLLALL